MAEEKQPVVAEEKLDGSDRVQVQTPITETPVAEAAPAETPEISDEDFLKAASKRLGREIKSVDELHPLAATEEVSEEDKKRQQSAQDVARIQKWVSKGPDYTAESYAALVRISKADIKELSLSDTRQELLAEGIDASEVEDVIKSRYYLLTDEEKENLSEYDQALVKKSEIFSKKLENRSGYKQKQAQTILSSLDAEITADNYVKQVDANLSAKVVEIAKNMDRKIVVEMGLSNNQQLNPIEYKIDDAEVAAITELLGDKAKRENFLYNQDGTENVENLFEALKWKTIAQSLAKKAHLDGATEQVNIFQTKFPNTPFAVAPGSVIKQGGSAEIGKPIEGSEKTSFRTQR